MIKTHKPRGHLWTHASEFQQTKEFRTIRLDECEAIATSKSVSKGASDNQTSREREAKRQRIEKLADDFLNGTPLFISSARLPPSSFKALAVRNTKEYSRPPCTHKEAVQLVQSVKHLDLSDDIDDDDDELAARLIDRSRQQPPARSLRTRSRAKGFSQPVVEETDRQQAKCRRIRRSRVINVTTGPSTEALQQAAALRARRSKITNYELSAIPRHVLETSPEPRRRSSSRSRSSSASRNSDRSRSRHSSLLSFSKYIPSDGSQDELRLSNSDTSARYPVGARKSNAGITHPDEIHSKAALEAKSEDQLREIEPLQSATDDIAPHLPHPTQTPQPPTQSSPPSRRTRSQTARTTANSPSRRKSGYTTAPSSQNGSTPFMFRKRRSASMECGATESVTPTATEQQAPRRHSHPLRQSCTLDGLSPMVAGESDSQSSHTAKASISSSGDATSNGITDGGATADSSEECFSVNTGSAQGDSTAQEVTSEAVPSAMPKESSDSHSNNDEDPSQSTLRAAGAVSQFWAGTQFLLYNAQKELFTSPEKPDPVLAISLQNRPSQNDETPKGRPPSSRREPLAQLSQELLPSTQQLLGNFEGWSTVKKPRSEPRPSSIPTPTAKAKGSSLGDDSATMTDMTFSALHTRPSSEQKGLSSGSNLRFSISSTAPPVTLFSTRNATPAVISPGSRSTQTLCPSSETNNNEPSMSSHERTYPADLEDESTRISEDPSLTNHFPASLTSFEMAQKSPSLLRGTSDLSQTIDDLKHILDLSEMHGVLSQVG